MNLAVVPHGTNREQLTSLKRTDTIAAWRKTWTMGMGPGSQKLDWNPRNQRRVALAGTRDIPVLQGRVDAFRQSHQTMFIIAGELKRLTLLSRTPLVSYLGAWH
jgi:hypothetical protein